MLSSDKQQGGTVDIQTLVRELTRLVRAVSYRGLEVQDIAAGKTYVVRLGRAAEAEATQSQEPQLRRTTW